MLSLRHNLRDETVHVNEFVIYNYEKLFVKAVSTKVKEQIQTGL